LSVFPFLTFDNDQVISLQNGFSHCPKPPKKLEVFCTLYRRSTTADATVPNSFGRPVLSNHFYVAHNILVEFVQLLCRYPAPYVLRHRPFVPRISFMKCAYTKPGHVSNPLRVVLRVPIASYAGRVFFVENRVKNWLAWKPIGKSFVAALPNEIEFSLSNRAVKDSGFRWLHSAV
jgi:hypothetical protein